MKSLFLIFFVAISFHTFSQVTTTGKTMVISGVHIIDPLARPTSYAPQLKNLEAPSPGGTSYRHFLNLQKQESARLFPAKSNRNTANNYGTAPDPVIIDEMNMRSYIAQIDKEGYYNGGTPLDNTMCMGNDYLLASVNSFLWAYDITGDSNLFVDDKGSTYNISFAEFGKDYITDPGVEFPFDPKLAYIPQHDKYVFMFLSGRTPSDSKIIVGFSSTNDPRDPWNVYMITGNPRGLDQWTDFPMFGFDNKDLYLSINLLKANTSWQLGFEGSIVWQIPMEEGFKGDTNLNITMYDDILYNGTKIRNLTPVQPGDSLSQSIPGITFLSNRNFDIQNDSLFVIDINEQKELSVSTIQLPKPYGVPPNGIQADDNPTDLTDGLQTNDSRFLGATRYTNSSKHETIEFVGNTKDFTTDRSAIYHGIITTSDSQSNPEIEATIIGVDSLDFGYPNIAYVNNGQGCYEGTLIAFNHTSLSTNAGISAIRHSNNPDQPGYSNIIRIKEGDGHVRRLSGSYERWGDYFGIQAVPGRPNEVYTAGFYGTSNNSSSTWFNRLSVSEDNVMVVDYTVSQSPFITNNAYVEIMAFNGYEPYSYEWSDGSTENIKSINLLTENSLVITDNKGCSIQQQIQEAVPSPASNLLYPNPVTDAFSLTFTVSQSTIGSFGIYDLTGKLIVHLGQLQIQEGANQFNFSTRPLSKGAYILLIQDSSDNNITQQSFIKL
ncbi:MAG: hypothetical protein ACI85Q_001002 [Salibacteraceae bacterium]|jgi:hypothetical protein